ncbi:MAG: glycerophosphodiester phosphodiesterase [bacterium]|nr:glycerophosphodiester phosphodiesterase [bacterium]
MTKKFIIYSLPFLIAFIAFSIFEPWIYQNWIASTSIDGLKGKEFKVIAHRGASGVAPENTLAAIGAALDMGVDMIDIDVRMSKDGEVVVIHDATVDRTTDGTGRVDQYTLSELKYLDAGSWKDSKFTGEKIPTLREVLDSINGRAIALIEIKHLDSTAYEVFTEHLVETIQAEKNGYEWCILQSYEPEYLEIAHDLDDKIQTKKLLVGEDSAPLIAFYMETKVQLGRATKRENEQLDALNPPYETLSSRRVFRMHARGFKVYTYLINDRETMIKMLNAGVDGIITDNPRELIKIREEIEALD